MKRKGNSEQAMESLFVEYYERLYLYALQWVQTDEDAQDIVSDTFAAVWHSWGAHGVVKEPTAAYLYAMVRNRCIDFLRHEQARTNYAAYVEQTTALWDDDPAEYEQQVAAIAALIEQLPEPDKSILQCTYFRQMTYEQTAAALQLTLAVVRRKMLGVFKRLRAALVK